MVHRRRQQPCCVTRTRLTRLLSMTKRERVRGSSATALLRVSISDRRTARRSVSRIYTRRRRRRRRTGTIYRAFSRKILVRFAVVPREAIYGGGGGGQQQSNRDRPESYILYICNIPSCALPGTMAVAYTTK